MLNYIPFLLNMIRKEENIILKPFMYVMGVIIDVAYNAISSITPENALGLSIIALTIIVKTITLPAAFKQQKSMRAMQDLAPQIAEIDAKYGDSKDPELEKKKNIEKQNLYSKNKVNPLSGCLPALVTLPIFFALSYLFQQVYVYVDAVGDVYNQLAIQLMSHDGYANVILPMVSSRTQQGVIVNLYSIADVMKAINIFSMDDWNRIFAVIPRAALPAFESKIVADTFLSISLIDPSGWMLPGILIPILSAGTSVLNTIVTMKRQTAGGDAQKKQQLIMTVVTTAMMFYFTVTMSAGLGIYWTTSNVYSFVQQILLDKFYKGGKAGKKKAAQALETPKKIELVDNRNPKNKSSKNAGKEESQ